MFRQAVHKTVDRLLIDHCAGGIVRISDEHEAGVFIDRIRHCIQIMGEARIWDFDVFCPEKSGHQFIDHEGVFCCDEFRSPVEKSVA